VSPQWRLGALGLVFAALFAILALWLWRIQVTQSEGYEELARQNQVRLVSTPAPRGDIYDRKGRLLAGTRSSLAAVADMALIDDDDVPDLAQNLAALLGLPASEIIAQLEDRRSDQVMLAEDLSDDQAVILAEHREDFPGVAVIPQPVRTYPEADLAAHVLGYIGKPSEEDLERPGVKGTDFVGKAGVERFYDDLLRGVEGQIKYRVDASGNVLERQGEQDPIAGGRLVLNIDADVQSQLQASLATGLAFARQLEMEQRVQALARESAAERMAAAAEDRAEEQAGEIVVSAESETEADVAEPETLDPADVLGPVYPGLPVDANGVCVPVQRIEIDLGKTTRVSGLEPRAARLDAITGEEENAVATITVAGETSHVRVDEIFAGTLQVRSIGEEDVVLLHQDKWCPVRTVGVVEDPNDGSIIAMASYPGFDPSAFVEGLTRDEWLSLGTESAFTNFAVQGLYAPASTFKAVAYMMAIEEGVYPIDRRPADVLTEARAASQDGDEDEEEVPLVPLTSHTDEYECSGEFVFEFNDGTRQRFRDWKWPLSHGPLDLHGALEASCDLYFWDLALRIWNERVDEEGINDENLFQDWARSLGFGASTGVDLPFERDGLIPDRVWFTKEQSEDSPRVRPKDAGPWSGGDLMNAIVGQGAVLTTPLQLANGYAAMVNGGTVWTPRVVDKVFDADGVAIDENPKTAIANLDLAPATVRLFRQDLWRVVNGENGTAEVAFSTFGPNVDQIGGKTGTGEVIKAPRTSPELQVDNAWFVGVAPVSSPDYVVAIVVERGGSGGRVAAPIARQVLQYLINGEEGVTELAPGLEAD
jgi:cell division protein FtsI/penicillin-binding protein 2